MARRSSSASQVPTQTCSPSTAGTRSQTPLPPPRRASRPASSRPCPSGTSSPSSGSTPGRCRTRRCGAPGMPTRIAAVLRQLHAGPRFRDDFDMFRVAERYLALVDERGDHDPGRLSRASRAAPADRGGARRPSARDRPMPQRPPRRELPRRRRTAVARRLGVQRQQRPGVRARQHRPGARLRRHAGRGAVRRLLRRAPRPPASPGCASR